MIPVTKPYLPPKNEYDDLVNKVWERNWLTNNGPLVNELELRLKKWLGVKHLLYVTSGTMALQQSIKALKLTKEVITTPFSYVATTSSIAWQGCKPRFVDIEEGSLNMNPKLIEEAITEDTEAIVATHCFGNACNIDAIQEVADKHKLKVIFDAAHCFGTSYNGESIFRYGDISTVSFHATKVFHTVEGGAVITTNPDLTKKMAFQRNFGHNGPEKFEGVGINGKNSEFHAAMGLSNLAHIKEILNRRKELSDNYDELLENLRVRKPELQHKCDFNYAYYPVIFENMEMCLKAKAALEQKNVFPRRYFYPSLSRLDYVDNDPTPISDDLGSRILCLPVYHSLSREEQQFIARILLRTQNYG